MCANYSIHTTTTAVGIKRNRVVVRRCEIYTFINRTIITVITTIHCLPPNRVSRPRCQSGDIPRGSASGIIIYSCFLIVNYQ